jgi:hypothetical protein
LWQAFRLKSAELSALVLRADDPGEAAAYVLAYLPKHFDYVFEQLYGRKRHPILGSGKAVGRVASRDGGHEADPA